MTDPQDMQQQIRELQEKVTTLSHENELLAEVAEDASLLGLIAEKINQLEDPMAVIDVGLEQISLLKDIPFCACCSIVDGQIRIESSFVSFSGDAVGISLTLPEDFTLSRSMLLRGAALDTANVTIVLPGQDYSPTSLLLIPFEHSFCPCGSFVFAGNDRLDSCEAMLTRVAELLTQRVSIIWLLRQLREARADLASKVEERTRELADAYRELKQEMAERISAQEEQQESDRLYRHLFDSMIEGFAVHEIICDEDGKPCDYRFLDVNPAFERLTGLKSEDVINRTVLELMPGTEKHWIERYGSVALTGEALHFEEFSSVLGKYYDVTVYCPAEGQFAVIFIDITERRKLEAQLLQSQKMESIGVLAGGIAHDFNNILTAIIGYGHLTMGKMQRDDPNRLNIEHMLEAAERAAHLTKDLLLFSRKQTINRKQVDINEIVRKIEKFLIRVIGEDIQFQGLLQEGTLPVLADSHQIEQVLMNLATNARDAMPKGGTLTVATSESLLDQQYVNLHGYGKPGRYVRITVSDTGEGMNEQTRQKIFEPFYTTKGVGKGTGLGLAVVYGIVKQHEGYIDVQSAPGKGTTFSISLPFAASGEAKTTLPIEKEHPMGGTERILLAEDNEAVRSLITSVLKDAGYTVIVAVDGEDAVHSFHQNKENIHLLLFDLIMPRKSGKEAYDEIRKLKSDIKILFVTGYAPDVIRDKASFGSGTAIIFKPVSPMELLRNVRAVLDKGKG